MAAILGIPTPVLAGVVVFPVAWVVLRRRALVEHLARPVQFTVGHVALFGLLLGLLFGSVVWVSHLNRESLDRERAARTAAEFRRVESEILTKREIRDIANRQAKLEAPTKAELARRSREALMACGRSSQCRASFTRVVNRVLRIEDGRLVPIPPRRGDRGTQPAEREQPAMTPRQPSVPGQPGPQGPQGPTGRAGRDVDSTVVDLLDNRLADVEQGLGAVLARLPVLNRLVDVLCRRLALCLG